MKDIRLICRECDLEAKKEKRDYADKYTCPKCSVSAYRQADGTWLMLKSTKGGRVFGLTSHSGIEITSTDMSDGDFPFLHPQAGTSP